VRSSIPTTVRVALCLLPLAALAESPVLDITGMTFVASRGSANEVVLRAEHAQMQSDSDHVQLQEVHTTVSSREDQPGFEMTCERGELDLETSDFYAEGDVRGTTHSGRIFTTEWVRYDHAEETLYTDAPVVITEGSSSYRGGGFRYHVPERRFRLLGGASVVQQP
jgi:LPS export ABC transporter protein LptC